MSLKNYKIVNDQWVELLDPPYQDITIKYGKVQLLPDDKNDELKLSFTYDIIDGDEPKDREAFVHHIGDILYDLIGEQLAQNSIVYTGGVDES
jgi:hypothetical protein